ncbi:MAG: hypothetical protein B7Y95_19380 [Rhizobiales bacterium 32-66-11]|nr:MAG: hypothetical protein B7Y95_19380 [Rhizobiales bacterium 32-66-11]
MGSVPAGRHESYRNAVDYPCGSPRCLGGRRPGGRRPAFRRLRPNDRILDAAQRRAGGFKPARPDCRTQARTGPGGGARAASACTAPGLLHHVGGRATRRRLPRQSRCARHLAHREDRPEADALLRSPSVQADRAVAEGRGDSHLRRRPPAPAHRVLDTLAANCVKATFFIVGRMASAYPSVLQEVHEAGHTIGTHSQTHPLIFPKLTHPAGIGEIEQGFASVNAGLAPIGAHTVPFFRFPGLGRTKFYEAYTQEHGIAVFSVDLVADDWMHLKPDEVLKRALDRLEARGSGILLLHDIQPSTAVMLPTLLHELKTRGFKVVHMVYGEGPDAVAALPAAVSAPGMAAKPTSAKPAAAHPAAAEPGTAQATLGAPAATPAKPVTAPVRPTNSASASNGMPSSRVPLPAPAPAAAAPTQANPPAAEQPFSLSWPRILTDILPKGLQPAQ